MNPKWHQSSRSFSLIEVVLACAILIMFLLAGIVLVQRASRSAATSKHRLQAIMLGKEAIDLAFAWRDGGYFGNNEDVFSGTNFETWITNNTNLKQCFNFDLAELAVPCPDPHSTTNTNIFRRSVAVANRGFPAEGKKVTVTVDWQDFSQYNSVQLITYLSEWQNF